MNKKFLEKLAKWPKHYIRSVDLQLLFPKGDLSRYGVVKRTLHSGILISLRRGVYLIRDRLEREPVNAFELAQILYGPSYISFEAALSFHGWIPEAVRATTSATVKRAMEVDTAVGYFTYTKIPSDNFFVGVNRVVQSNSIFFVADPWKAVADIIYAHKRNWKSMHSFSEDMRVEWESILTSNKAMLSELSNMYPNPRTRNVLKKIAEYDY